MPNTGELLVNYLSISCQLLVNYLFEAPLELREFQLGRTNVGLLLARVSGKNRASISRKDFSKDFRNNRKQKKGRKGNEKNKKGANDKTLKLMSRQRIF